MAQWVNLLDLIYPSGSVYVMKRDSGSETDGTGQSNTPGAMFGGAWTLIGYNDRFFMYVRG